MSVTLDPVVGCQLASGKQESVPARREIFHSQVFKRLSLPRSGSACRTGKRPPHNCYCLMSSARASGELADCGKLQAYIGAGIRSPRPQARPDLHPFLAPGIAAGGGCKFRGRDTVTPVCWACQDIIPISCIVPVNHQVQTLQPVVSTGSSQRLGTLQFRTAQLFLADPDLRTAWARFLAGETSARKTSAAARSPFSSSGT